MTRYQYTATTQLNTGLRGSAIPQNQREIVERLRTQAFAVQKRFELAERTAMILERMIDPDTGAAAAIDQTYEAHSFSVLQFQLFRLLVIDICAAVLDDDQRTGSICAVLRELRRDSNALDALRAYYSDTSGLTVTVDGPNLSDDEVEELKRELLARHAEEAVERINTQWDKVDSDSVILNSDEARRLKWARNKVIAHFEKSGDRLVALDDDPPWGEGKLDWIEPIEFLDQLREHVYDVFLLITDNSWDTRGEGISKFYAAAFWDRFINGKTDMIPGNI